MSEYTYIYWSGACVVHKRNSHIAYVIKFVLKESGYCQKVTIKYTLAGH